MKKYTIGLITGALLAVSTMMFMGAQNKNLGDITVNSITVKDDGSGGFLTTQNADGKMTAYLGTAPDGSGWLTVTNGGTIETHNTDGKPTSYLGTAVDGSGFLATNNKHGVRVGYFGSGNSQDGLIGVFDRYGDIGWTADGKK